MFEYACRNCRHVFTSGEEQSACPRCSSRDLTKQGAGERKPLRVLFSSSGQRIYGDTKDAWKSFHGTAPPTKCPKCGGEQFTLDFRHKEKTCKNCGEILPMRRRPA